MECSNRLRDVLEVLLACIPKLDPQLVSDLVTHDLADANATRLAQVFEPGSHVHAVSVNVFRFDDNIADVDPNPKLNSLGRWDLGILFGHFSLDFNCATDRIDNAGKLDQHAIPRRLDNSAAVLADLRVNQRSAVVF